MKSPGGWERVKLFYNRYEGVPEPNTLEEAVLIIAQKAYERLDTVRLLASMIGDNQKVRDRLLNMFVETLYPYIFDEEYTDQKTRSVEEILNRLNNQPGQLVVNKYKPLDSDKWAKYR
jgi:membrane-associated HD superfamily phosphohydrolase